LKWVYIRVLNNVVIDKSSKAGFKYPSIFPVKWIHLRTTYIKEYHSNKIVYKNMQKHCDRWENTFNICNSIFTLSL